MSAAPDQAPQPGNTRYSAFISYSHAADGVLAKTVQNALQKLNKSWFKLRARRVFRDQSGLALTPALWEAIERALADSSHLILFASPASAQSEWVRKELDWWLQHRSAERLFIVWTEGQLTREATGADYDWSKTNALPDVLAGKFRSTPLYLDLRWARDQKELSLRHPRFADAMAQITASLEGVTPDEVISEDIRQHRKAMWLLRATGIFLAAVTVAALATSFITLKLGQRVSPLVRKEQQAAQLQASENESRRLADLSLRATDPQLTMLLAREAARVRLTPEAESALRRSLAGESKPSLTFPGDEKSDSFSAYSPDGSKILVWNREGQAHIADAKTGRNLHQLEGPPREYVWFTIDRQGARVVAADRKAVATVWDLATGRRLFDLSHTNVSSAGFSPDGTQILTVAIQENALLWDASNGTFLRAVEDDRSGVLVAKVVGADFNPNGRQIQILHLTDVVLRDAKTDEIQRTLDTHTGYLHSSAFSPDGEWLATTAEDRALRIWRTVNGRNEKVISHEEPFFNAVFSPDGRWLAARDKRNILFIWRAGTWESAARIETQQDPSEPVFFEFSPDGACVMTSGNDSDSAVLWETRTGHKLSELPGSDGHVRTLSFSPDGTRAAIGGIGFPGRIHDCPGCGQATGMVSQVQSRLTRQLTVEERRQYGLKER